MENKECWRMRLKPYMIRSNYIAFFQVANTLLPFLFIWALFLTLSARETLLIFPCVVMLTALVLRCFVLMHDCGHGSLFQTIWLNRFFGFLFGVITGMPQYVWSRHHAFHHKTNGDWDRYRGPLSTFSTEEFAKLTPSQQKRYAIFRHPIFFSSYWFFLYII